MSTELETVSVVAVGVPVPMEGGGGSIESAPKSVPNTWYYRRQIADGSLRLATDSDRGPADSAGPSLDNDTPAAPVATTTSKKKESA